MSEYLFALVLVYLVGVFFKMCRFHPMVIPAVAGWFRMRWRMTGDPGSSLFLVIAYVGIWSILFVTALLWPRLLLKEGRRFFLPYNAWAVMRQAMRGVQAVHKR